MSSWYEQIMSVAQEDPHDTQDDSPESGSPWPENDTPAEDQGHVHQALLEFVRTELSTEERLIITLRYCEELTIPEIGAVLNQPAAHVGAVHDRVVARVRKWLKNMEAKEVLIS